MATIGEVNQTPKGHVEWKIHDMSLIKTEEEYTSPVLSLEGASWFFRLTKLTERNDVIFSGFPLALERISCGPPISISLEASLGSETLDEKQYHFHLNRITCNYEKKLFFLGIFPVQSCRIQDYVLTVIMKNPESSEDANVASLCQDYKKVLLDGKNHDLILKVGERELRAHRDILRARSRIFDSMLNHDMREKNSGVIDVSDCDPQAMELFLSYVYCGKVETLDQNNMLGLYYIADKYEMERLKEECCDFIKKSLSITNICDVIQVALNHSDFSLLEYAKEYFMNNTLDIMRTVEWQIFLKDNSTVGNELLIKSMEKLKI